MGDYALLEGHLSNPYLFFRTDVRVGRARHGYRFAVATGAATRVATHTRPTTWNATQW